MQKAVVTVDEFVQTLKRSSLPTVITEGSDDYKFYRRIEENLAAIDVSLFPVGGRNNVLEIFNRRRELGRNNVVFLADRDLWVFDEVPAQYAHRKIVYTTGYSIENDLYSDGAIEDFLHANEKQAFRSELDQLLHWYSFAVARLLSNQACSIADHPGRVLNQNGTLDTTYMASIGYGARNEQIYHLVAGNYKHLLRGKNLIELILRQLSARSRSIKFSRNQIMEIGAARKGANMQRISSDLKSLINLL